MLAERPRLRRHLTYALPLVTGLSLAALIGIVLREPLGIAFAGLIGVVLLVPMMAGDLRDSDGTARSRMPLRADYLLAIAPLLVLTGIAAGATAALIVGVVAASLLGSVDLLAAIRLPPRIGCALVIIQACAFLSWPVWAADWIGRHDVDAWVQRVINVSPAFALNGVIAPEASFTHRPRMYFWTNLGQDVPFAMPRSAWTCVGLHGAIGVWGLAAGGMSRRWARMNADEDKLAADQLCLPLPRSRGRGPG